MPLRGQRLEYLVAQIGTDFRVLMKESIGSWLSLIPLYPETGTFAGSGTNKGTTYAKRAGFRFVSYKFLLVPGTSITQPGKGTSTTTSKVKLATISIGFPRGKKNAHTSVHNIINFAKSCSQASAIMGIVSPTGRKYQWRGKLPGSQAGTDAGGVIAGAAVGLGGLLF